MRLITLGHINSSRSSAIMKILDSYTGATFGLSAHRQLKSAYAGPCMKVRRSSDNTEQDIGFVSGLLDTASLLTFTGAGNGFVSKWYDQSGNGNDFIQTTLGNQPKIVSTGSVLTKNGNPTLTFDTSVHQFLQITTTNFSGMVFDIYGVISIDGYGSDATNACILSVVTTHNFWMLGGPESLVNPPLSYVQSGGGNQIDAIGPADGLQKVLNMFVSSGNVNTITYNDHSGFSVVGAPTAIGTGSRVLKIGRDGLTSTADLMGGIQELLVWSTNNVADKSAIKSNQKSEYSVPDDICTTLPYSEAFTGLVSWLPTNWLSSDPADIIVVDPLSEILVPYCNVGGSSGTEALGFINTSGVQAYANVRPVSTLNKTAITINFNQFRHIGSPPLTIEWSTDNTTWNTIASPNVTDDAFWHSLSPVVLPAGAEDQYTLYVRIGMLSDSSGLVSVIDDLVISGT